MGMPMWTWTTRLIGTELGGGSVLGMVVTDGGLDRATIASDDCRGSRGTWIGLRWPTN